MRRSRRALGVGMAVVAVYLGLGAVSGRLSPLARRPLLDGFAPPPPYNYVSPPPDLASTNKEPASGRFRLDLDPTAGSEPKVVATSDFQASMALPQGAIPSRPQDSSVLLVISPLTPGSNLTLPSGLELVGNVYRFSVNYRPGNAAVPRFGQEAQVVLAYPLRSHSLTFRHTLLRSDDGTSWTAVTSTESIAQQLVQGNVTAPGFFAVGESGSGIPASRSGTNLIATILLWALVALVAAAFVLSEVRRRRKRTAPLSSTPAAPRSARRPRGRSDRRRRPDSGK